MRRKRPPTRGPSPRRWDLRDYAAKRARAQETDRFLQNSSHKTRTNLFRKRQPAPIDAKWPRHIPLKAQPRNHDHMVGAGAAVGADLGD